MSKELFDELSKALTCYENNEDLDGGYATPTEISNNLYEVAVKVKSAMADEFGF